MRTRALWLLLSALLPAQALGGNFTGRGFIRSASTPAIKIAGTHVPVLPVLPLSAIARPASVQVPSQWQQTVLSPTEAPAASTPDYIKIVESPKISVHRRSDGSRFIYLFPFVKTEVEFVEGKPYVTVYRGLTDKFDPNATSDRFGEHLYTSLSPKIAVSYMEGRTVTIGDYGSHLTLLKMRLPLEQAYIAKRGKEPGDKDVYFNALSHRSYMWWGWKAPQRRRERELVWNLAELEGGLLNPKYRLQLHEAALDDDSVHPFAQWGVRIEKALSVVSEIRKLIEKGQDLPWKDLPTQIK